MKNQNQKFENLIDLDLIENCRENRYNIYEYCKDCIDADRFTFFTENSEVDYRILNKYLLKYAKEHYNYIPKMFNIMHETAGQDAKVYYSNYPTFEESQKALRDELHAVFSSLDNIVYWNKYHVDKFNKDFEDLENVEEDEKMNYYTEDGWYNSFSNELEYSDEQINSPDFDRFSYDNKTWFIKEVE